MRLFGLSQPAAAMTRPGEAPVALHISLRNSGDVTILDLRGRATIGRSNDLLAAELRRVVDAGSKKILVNLAEVAQVDSSGISTIVRNFVSLQRSGGSLKLLNPSGKVREVLDVTRLLRSIPTFDDEKEALARFQ